MNDIYNKGGNTKPKLATPKVPTIFKKSKKLGITLVIKVKAIIIRILSEYIFTFFLQFESSSLLKKLYFSIISNAHNI